MDISKLDSNWPRGDKPTGWQYWLMRIQFWRYKFYPGRIWVRRG